MKRRSKRLLSRGAAIIALVGLVGCGRAAAREQDKLPDCEWCGASEAPPDLSWSVQLADDNEPGDRLVVEGTVEYPDGTPATDAVLYVYHTNATGRYEPGPRPRGNERRHGALRGWIRPQRKTGRYRIETIRPASYPNRSEPAHIHLTVKQPGRDEYWLPSFLFADDPLLIAKRRAKPSLETSGVVEPTRDARGVWRARRRIVLRPRSAP